MKKNILFYLGLIGILSSCQSKKLATAETNDNINQPVPTSGYSYSYWLNGWRKNNDDKRADIFGIETNKYGFVIDVDDFSKVKFGKIDNPVSYRDALEHKGEKLRNLPDANMVMALEIDGDVYQAKLCKPGRRKKLSTIRMWESGRYAQHFDFTDLEFANSEGKKLLTSAKLDLTAWPESLTFNLEAEPALLYQDGIHKGVVGNGLCVIDKPLHIPHSKEIDPEEFTLECWVKIPAQMQPYNTHSWLVCKNKNEWADGNFGIQMINNNRFIVHLNIGGGAKNDYQINVHNNQLKKGQWTCLAMSYDGNMLTFYVNGRKIQQKKVGKKRVPGTGQLTIGQRSDGYKKPVNGLFDQVRIWNRALTQKQIQAHAKHPAQIADKTGLMLNKNFEDAPKFVLKESSWKNAVMRLGLNDWQKELKIDGDWKLGEVHKVTLNCNLKPVPKAEVTVKALGENFPVKFDKERNCYFVYVHELKRKFKRGNADIRDYDEFDISVKAKPNEYVPFLLHFRFPASITGLCPILCDKEGRPTGIPIQLSKNWHYAPMGCYLMAYSMLPPGDYILRVAYGFYGKYPSASHSQLSLIGYGGNGRWEQLAIGCWGETICFDGDLSLVPNMITDIRMLMARKGKDGKKWSWTDAGWGGDWLNISDRSQEKFYPMELKTAYVSQGPCLSDVKFNGYYGKNKDIDYKAQVKTLRTDDFNRTFQTFSYTFNHDVAAKKISLFKIGKYSPGKIYYGNKKGLLNEIDVPADLKTKKQFMDNVKLEGEAPYWLTFPTPQYPKRDWGTGYRALIIRSYKVVVDGKAYHKPTFSTETHRKHGVAIDVELLPPKGIKTFKKGDKIELDIEFITLPRIADDYYGPNKAFVDHLTANPLSWKTTYREAIGNDLKVDVKGGCLLNSYPVAVKVKDSEVRVLIKGGVGIVPISFEGLESTGYSLYQDVDGHLIKVDQSVHGNDYWQTDFDPKTNTFKLTYNIPLDGLKQSEWILKKN